MSLDLQWRPGLLFIFDINTFNMIHSSLKFIRGYACTHSILKNELIAIRRVWQQTWFTRHDSNLLAMPMGVVLWYGKCNIFMIFSYSRHPFRHSCYFLSLPPMDIVMLSSSLGNHLNNYSLPSSLCIPLLYPVIWHCPCIKPNSHILLVHFCLPLSLCLSICLWIYPSVCTVYVSYTCTMLFCHPHLPPLSLSLSLCLSLSLSLFSFSLSLSIHLIFYWEKEYKYINTEINKTWIFYRKWAAT